MQPEVVLADLAVVVYVLPAAGVLGVVEQDLVLVVEEVLGQDLQEEVVDHQAVEVNLYLL